MKGKGILALAVAVMIAVSLYATTWGEPDMPEMTKEPAPAVEYHAEIMSLTAPETVNHTDSYTIQITMKNTGSKAWSENEQIRLCIWQDGVDWGYRIGLPDGASIAPGEEHTFVHEEFVLPEAPSTVLEYQMVQEGVMYFGEKRAVTITAE